MKINKMISIDLEIMKKLRGENASALINGLLQDYFKQDNTEEIKENSKDLRQKMAKNRLKLAKIEQKEAKNERISSINLHPKLREWFKRINERPSILAIDEFRKAHKIERDTPILDILKKWDEINDNK